MGQSIQISTSRMQCVGAWLARAQGNAKGGLVVAQEIFGVNAHMRDVVERFAAHGYTTIAPAFFDHVERDVELEYTETGFQRGRELVSEIGLDLALEDVASAAESIASAGRIGCVGYCWGGTVALLAAIRLGMPAVSYYGARNTVFLDEQSPVSLVRGPLQFHFGEHDRSIPPEAVARHRASLPEAEVYTYPAGHGFNRDVDETAYIAPSAQLALERTLAFLDRHLAGA